MPGLFHSHYDAASNHIACFIGAIPISRMLLQGGKISV